MISHPGGVGTVQKTSRIAFLAAAALALPVALNAQTQPAPAPAQPAAPATAPAAAPQDEAAQLQSKITALQQRALQDPSLKPAQDSFTAVVNAGMAKLDPAATGKLARAAALNGDVEAARAANDNAKLNQLATEAQQLQAYFQALQPRVAQLPEVQAARQTFMQRVFAKMKELDPNAQQYVDRLTQLRSGTSGR
jgi:outer membrane murein-binding lipoprotein Lpp